MTREHTTTTTRTTAHKMTLTGAEVEQILARFLDIPTDDLQSAVKHEHAGTPMPTHSVGIVLAWTQETISRGDTDTVEMALSDEALDDMERRNRPITT